MALAGAGMRPTRSNRMSRNPASGQVLCFVKSQDDGDEFHCDESLASAAAWSRASQVLASGQSSRCSKRSSRTGGWSMRKRLIHPTHHVIFWCIELSFQARHPTCAMDLGIVSDHHGVSTFSSLTGAAQRRVEPPRRCAPPPSLSEGGISTTGRKSLQ